MNLILLAVTAGLGATLLGAGLRLRRTYVVVLVDGDSMLPALRSTDRLLLRRTPSAEIRVGQIVVLRKPRTCGTGGGWLVKRVVATPGDPIPAGVPNPVDGAGLVPPDRLVVLGDNTPLSHDSRHYGPIDATKVLGVALRRLRHRHGERAALYQEVPENEDPGRR